MSSDAFRVEQLPNVTAEEVALATKLISKQRRARESTKEEMLEYLGLTPGETLDKPRRKPLPAEGEVRYCDKHREAKVYRQSEGRWRCQSCKSAYASAYGRARRSRAKAAE